MRDPKMKLTKCKFVAKSTLAVCNMEPKFIMIKLPERFTITSSLLWLQVFLKMMVIILIVLQGITGVPCVLESGV